MRLYKLSHISARRLRRLLHLEYSPAELACEIGCSQRKILTAIEGGCPHRRTESGHFRIIGDAFRDWYTALCRRRKKPLGPNEAFCLACRRPVPLPPENQLQIHPLPNGNERIEARCPICQNAINRIRNAEVAL